MAAWTGRTEALGGRIVRHDGLASFLTGLPAPPFNPTVVERASRDPAAALAAAESAYGPVGLPFGIDLDPERWPVSRRAAEGAGLTLIDSRPLMALTPDQLVTVGVPDGVLIAPGGEVLDEMARVDTAAFGGDVGVNRAFIGGAERDPGARVYAAFLDGVVVGSGETFVADGVMGVFGVATAPEARRRGIGERPHVVRGLGPVGGDRCRDPRCERAWPRRLRTAGFPGPGHLRDLGPSRRVR